jgi:hypothetical protein
MANLPFMDLVQKAQQAELEEFERKQEQDRKIAEQLRLSAYPGTITARDLLKEREDPEEKLNKQFDEAEAAARRAEKEKKDAERADAEAPFPPPVVTTPG